MCSNRHISQAWLTDMHDDASSMPDASMRTTDLNGIAPHRMERTMSHQISQPARTGVALLGLCMLCMGLNTPAGATFLIEKSDQSVRMRIETYGDTKVSAPVDTSLPAQIPSGALVWEHNGQTKAVLSTESFATDGGIRQDNIGSGVSGDFRLLNADYPEDTVHVVLGASGETEGTWQSAAKVLSSAQPISTVVYVDGQGVFEQTGAEGMHFAYANIQTPLGLEGRTVYDSGAGTDFYYIKDHLGSTRAVLDRDGGLVEGVSYQAYGDVDQLLDAEAAGSEDPVREKFTGKEYDEDGREDDKPNGSLGMQLVYFGMRYLDPEVGIWTSTDPMDEFWNSYSYVGGNPVNLLDRWGGEVDTSCRGGNTNLAKASKLAENNAELAEILTDMVNDPNIEYSDADFARFLGGGQAVSGGGSRGGGSRGGGEHVSRALPGFSGSVGTGIPVWERGWITANGTPSRRPIATHPALLDQGASREYSGSASSAGDPASYAGSFAGYGGGGRANSAVDASNTGTESNQPKLDPGSFVLAAGAPFHFDYTNAGERLIHYTGELGKFRFNSVGEWVKHTGQRIAEELPKKGKKALKYLKNVKPTYFTGATLILMVIPPGFEYESQLQRQMEEGL